MQERRDGRALLSRESLIADIERKGLLTLVPAEVKQLFGLLESEFDPLQLCKVVSPLLESLQTLNQPVTGGRQRSKGRDCRVKSRCCRVCCLDMCMARRAGLHA
jgi:hypothetical protein